MPPSKPQIEKLMAVKAEHFGKDHWSTFGYIDTLCVDFKGKPDHNRMRTNAERHPWGLGTQTRRLYESHGRKFNPQYGTRLNIGAQIPWHDDWDCAEDLAYAGLIEMVEQPTTGIMVEVEGKVSVRNPQDKTYKFSMTPKGTKVIDALRAWKRSGGTFSTFRWK